METHGIPGKVYGRSKHLYGIWRKMGVQAKGLDEIHDWLAYRIICPDRASCYTALGLGARAVPAHSGRFKDYISLPKDNGYQSIHTSVFMPTGDAFEVQIRTPEMHDHAENGIASHWTYKEGHIANRSEINQVAFLRRMWSCTRTAATAGTWWPTRRASSAAGASRSSRPRATSRACRKARRPSTRLRHPHGGRPPLRGGEGERAHGAPEGDPAERRPGGGAHPPRPQAQPGLADAGEERRRQEPHPGLHPRGGTEGRHRHGPGPPGAGGPGPPACTWRLRRPGRSWKPA
ncbi:MAG: hypothetical protein IPL96_17300 [Holophagaceae bacterium]|nr:hypothetical protein [Holophagaceae bacterium]